MRPSKEKAERLPSAKGGPGHGPVRAFIGTDIVPRFLLDVSVNGIVKRLLIS